MGGGDDGSQHPNHLSCFVNQEVFDFNAISAVHPAQQFNLPVNSDGMVELTTVIHPFTNVTSIAFYFPSNHGGGDITLIRYIGMQGEHTHYRREAVNAVYEVLCNGQDVQTEGEIQSSTTGHLH